MNKNESINTFNVNSIDLGVNFHQWISYNEKIPFDNLKDEVTNFGNIHIEYECISNDIYNNIKNKCIILYNSQINNNNNNQFIFELQELISLKLYSDLSNYQSVFRKVFWNNKLNIKKRKYFFNGH